MGAAAAERTAQHDETLTGLQHQHTEHRVALRTRIARSAPSTAQGCSADRQRGGGGCRGTRPGLVEADEHGCGEAQTRLRPRACDAVLCAALCSPVPRSKGGDRLTRQRPAGTPDGRRARRVSAGRREAAFFVWGGGKGGVGG